MLALGWAASRGIAVVNKQALMKIWDMCQVDERQTVQAHAPFNNEGNFWTNWQRSIAPWNDMTFLNKFHMETRKFIKLQNQKIAKINS